MEKPSLSSLPVHKTTVFSSLSGQGGLSAQSVNKSHGKPSWALIGFLALTYHDTSLTILCSHLPMIPCHLHVNCVRNLPSLPRENVYLVKYTQTLCRILYTIKIFNNCLEENKQTNKQPNRSWNEELLSLGMRNTSFQLLISSGQGHDQLSYLDVSLLPFSNESHTTASIGPLSVLLNLGSTQGP